MLNFSCAKHIPFVPISGTGKFLDRSVPRARGFVQPFAKKKMPFKSDAKRELWNHLFPGILFSAGCYISYGEKIPFHGRDIKTGDQFCVWDVARTWNGSRGKIFNTPLPPPPSEFPIQLRSIRNLFIFCDAPLHLLKTKLME